MLSRGFEKSSAFRSFQLEAADGKENEDRSHEPLVDRIAVPFRVPCVIQDNPEKGHVAHRTHLLLRFERSLADNQLPDNVKE
jgi:hypothetical protein